MECFFDIETVPSADPDVIAEIAEGIAPPKSMSKDDTIARWEREEKPRLVAEAVQKTGLDGATGRICCIAYAFGGGEVKAVLDRSEKAVLNGFFDACDDAARVGGRSSGAREKLVAVGHAVVDFDLRFTWQRAVVNRIKPAGCLPWNAKPWDESVRDTMTMWNPARDRKISLHNLCRALGVKSSKDGGITGADIANLWRRRQYPLIIGYACDDVRAMRECYLRMA